MTSTTNAPGTVDTPHGTLTISNRVLYSLAQQAAMGTYGVVGLASKYTGFDTTRTDPSRGLEITVTPGGDLRTHVTVTIHVIVEYGVRIRSVTSSLQHQIAYAIGRSTGYAVDAVFVNVSGLRVTDHA
jgi:uncharacterized alkaline shock family protein YloU